MKMWELTARTDGIAAMIEMRLKSNFEQSLKYQQPRPLSGFVMELLCSGSLQVQSFAAVVLHSSVVLWRDRDGGVKHVVFSFQM